MFYRNGLSNFCSRRDNGGSGPLGQYHFSAIWKNLERRIWSRTFLFAGTGIGIKIDPDGIHVMKKSQYSGMFGDYSSYSEEYEEIGDASLEPDEADGEDGDEKE